MNDTTEELERLIVLREVADIRIEYLTTLFTEKLMNGEAVPGYVLKPGRGSNQWRDGKVPYDAYEMKPLSPAQALAKDKKYLPFIKNVSGELKLTKHNERFGK